MDDENIPILTMDDKMVATIRLSQPLIRAFQNHKVISVELYPAFVNDKNAPVEFQILLNSEVHIEG